MSLGRVGCPVQKCRIERAFGRLDEAHSKVVQIDTVEVENTHILFLKPFLQPLVHDWLLYQQCLLGYIEELLIANEHLTISCRIPARSTAQSNLHPLVQPVPERHHYWSRPILALLQSSAQYGH